MVRARHRALAFCCLLLLTIAASPARPQGAAFSAHLPAMLHNRAPCPPIPWEAYASLTPDSAPTDRPAHEHGDINLALRGYVPAHGLLGLVDYSGATDSHPPQLAGLWADGRLPRFLGNHQVRQWDWDRNSPGEPISHPQVTLLAVETWPGEPLHLPARGATIGSGYEALVLYADLDRITLKYTREDDVVWGYTLHVEGVCVEPRLLALYHSLDHAGRNRLPALDPGQAFGRARGSEIKVAIRDTGSFMDPRSRKDWWQGH